MAISKTNQSLSLALLAFITVFLMLLNRVNSADSLHFTIDKFSADQEDLILQGDATIGDNVLQLTKLNGSGHPEEYSVGRVLYSTPVLLWKSPSDVASFTTTFTFKISPSDSSPGDGIAFFIASPDTKIPPYSYGKFLGLFPDPDPDPLPPPTSSGKRIKDDASEAVVAVELDTFPNADIGDPNYPHLGLDINSIKSVKNVTWHWEKENTVTATITYNQYNRKRLVATASLRSSLDYDNLDLSAILPQWVRVGISASTGKQIEKNTLLSWTFTSNFPSNQIQKEAM